MKVSVISFTKKGGALNERLCYGLKSCGVEAVGYTTPRYTKETGLKEFTVLGELVEQFFLSVDGILFIGACGIAVRAIAPFIKSKAEDPAVIVTGEDGNYVISLLSGHIGGANELCRQAAAIIGAVPVITTATDLNNTFAVDIWAVENKLVITDLTMIKEISGAVLNGEKVGFSSEYPVKGALPCELAAGTVTDIGICISDTASVKPFQKTLTLLPRNITIGIGCRKGTETGVIMDFITETFHRYELDVRRINRICSIDLKAEEEGILNAAKALQVEFITFPADVLEKVPGEFAASDFVRKTVGVDNVCERSAALGSSYGSKRISKVSNSGVTLSAYEMDFAVAFKQNGAKY